LSLLTSTKNDLCPLWIAISWRVQVRKCAYGTKICSYLISFCCYR
jgi:hypothetical protein